MLKETRRMPRISTYQRVSLNLRLRKSMVLLSISFTRLESRAHRLDFVRGEDISDTPNGMDQFRLKAFVNLLSEIVDIDIDHIGH